MIYIFVTNYFHSISIKYIKQCTVETLFRPNKLMYGFPTTCPYYSLDGGY
jgi:hypothetical protein